MLINEGQELRMKNVLSYRAKITQTEFNNAGLAINKFIEDGGFKKTGPTVSVTFSIEQQGADHIMDTEILIPLDKEFNPPDGCTKKPEFYLTNALAIKNIDSLVMVQKAYEVLSDYIARQNLQAITSAYNVTIQEPKTLTGDGMIMDVYIGVSRNIL